jgi:hypothetical protein
MRNTATYTLAALACLLPAAGCSILAKGGVSVGGKSLPASPKTDTAKDDGERAPSGATAATKPAASPFQAAPVAPAPTVDDSVSAISADLTVAPAQGAPVIALEGAPWCTSEVKGLDWDGVADRKFKQQVKKVGDLYGSGLESMSRMARFACGGTKSAARLSWVESYMQAQANALGMTQQHMTHLMSVAASPDFDGRDFSNYAPDGCKAFEAKGHPNRLESERNQALRIGMGCADGGNASWMSWWMDRGANIDSQVEKLGWLYSAFAYSARVVSFQTGALALHDAQSFDQEAFFAELAERGADDQVIAKAIIQYYKTRTKLGEWTKHYQDELGEDYATLTKAAEDGFQSWVAAYQKDRAAVDFAFQMEEAKLEGDMRRFQGCSEKARQFATDYVLRNEPQSIEDIQSAAAQPIGTLIVAAAYECEKALDRPLEAAVYAEMLKGAAVSRGPRFAARLALVRAVGEIKKMKTRFPLRARDFMPEAPRDGFGHASAGYFESGQGVVARAKKKADTVEVSFKKESWNEPIYKCVETHRLDRIEADGTLVYRKKCRKTGSKKMSSQEKPITLPASAAAGIRPGSFLVVARSKKNSSEGLPRRVYASKKRDKIVNFYGLPLR